MTQCFTASELIQQWILFYFTNHIARRDYLWYIDLSYKIVRLRISTFPDTEELDRFEIDTASLWLQSDTLRDIDS